MRVLSAPFVMMLLIWGLYVLAKPRKKKNG